jgi:Rhodopirellula transposase DDE domain
MPIHVSHFPPGTSKWNKVEHRLFSFISISWRGGPLRTYGTIIDLIGNTTNRGGLVVRVLLGCRNYPTGKKVSAKELRELKIERDEFHGDWNYRGACLAELAADRSLLPMLSTTGGGAKARGYALGGS